MRRPHVCTLALAALLSLAAWQAPAFAQKESLANIEIELRDFLNPMSFKEFLGLLQDKLPAKQKVPLFIDWKAFAEDFPDAYGGVEGLYSSQIKPLAVTESKDAKTTLARILDLGLGQLPTDTAYVIRGNAIDITTRQRTRREYLLNQTFFKNFEERPLHDALNDLSDLSGVSIILDRRVKEKDRTAVTAKFRNDVALQDAVRMLAEMAELKVVHLVTGLFVTTPEHALGMQKELRKLYEPYAPPGGGPAPFGVPGLEVSPLTPPLPPPPRGGLPGAV